MKNFKTPTRARKIYLSNGDIIENCRFYILGGFIVIDTISEIYNANAIVKIELRESIDEETGGNDTQSVPLYDESTIVSEKELIKQLEG